MASRLRAKNLWEVNFKAMHGKLLVVLLVVVL
jgi:hypothetical protein